MKLNRLLKELTGTKELLLDKYLEIEELRQMNDRLRQLNAKLSKELKDLKKYLTTAEKNNKMLKENVKGKTISEI